MAYTLEQIYEALGKIENGGTMVADLQDVIRSTRDEAAKSRIEKNKIGLQDQGRGRSRCPVHGRG